MDSTSDKAQAFVMERVFDAPREAVWRAWTDPEWFRRWWGPEHFTAPACRMDVRPGGRFLWTMRDPDGNDYHTGGEFLEVVPPERLVYTDSFADEHGNVIPAAQFGMGEAYPDTTVVTVTFEDLGGRTKLRIAGAAVPDPTMAEMARLGWSTSLDKLAAVVEAER